MGVITMTHVSEQKQRKISIIRDQLLNYKKVDLQIKSRMSREGLPIFSLFVGRLKVEETTDLSINVYTTLFSMFINDTLNGLLESFYNYCKNELHSIPRWFNLTEVGKQYISEMGVNCDLPTNGISYIFVNYKQISSSELNMLFSNLGFIFTEKSINIFSIERLLNSKN